MVPVIISCFALSTRAQTVDTAKDEYVTESYDLVTRSHVISVGIDPFFLLVGSLWSKAEIRVTPCWSLAGHFATSFDAGRRGDGLVGADICWYPIGTFEHGIGLIAHIVYRHDSVFFNGTNTGPAIPGYRRILGYGPMLGFKYIFPIELTGYFQIGIMREQHETKAQLVGYNENRTSFDVWGYFNLGWSF